jgi:cellulose synthase/poly-beta-1,6-N-acetylglucosamine synthase-like glycosyltransferase
MLVWLAWLLIGSTLFMVTFYMNIYHESSIEEEVGSPQLEKEPSVSILMPAYNEEDVVEKALENSLSLDYGNYEVVFVDDGSSDSTLEKAKQYSNDSKLRIMEHEQNKGKGHALNTALSHTDADYMIVQDADSIINSRLIRKAASKMEADSGTGAVITSIRPLNTDTFVQKLQIIEYTLTNFYRNVMSDVDLLDITPGAFSMYRTQQVKDLEGFDTDNLTEDLELAWRIRRSGKSIEMTFHESAHTEFPSTLRELYGQRVRWARGFISNAWKKKDMFFNEKYGWFGRFHLPVQLLMPIISVIGFWMVAIGWGQGLFSFAVNVSATGLSLPTLPGGDLQRMIMGFPAVILVPMGTAMGFSAYELKVAYSESENSFRDLVPLLLYFFMFFMLKGFFWMVAILKELRRSEEIWT